MGHSILFLIFLVAGGAFAAPSATVEIVRSPAWLDQGGQRVALAPGAALDSDARLVTGAQARVVIRLAEGSTVKLGESTRLSLSHMPESTLYKAALNVLVGAFRFTTTALGQGFRRDIRATVGTATIGIRGTDVWGKAAADRDFVVLIEGTIDITRAGHKVTMSTPQTIFNALKDRSPEPIAPVAGNALAGWATETEPQIGNGLASSDGKWRVVIGQYRHAPSSRAVATLLNSAGFPATVSEGKNRNTHFQVILDHYLTDADASAVAARIQALFPTLHPAIEESSR